MRLLMYRVNGRRSHGKRDFEGNFEKILFITSVAVFFLLVAVQMSLLSPTVRKTLEVHNSYEGEPLGTEEYLYKEGVLKLELINAESDENLKVMVNGVETAAFSSRSVDISVKNGDVVEIDGSSAKNDLEVEILNKSDNISSQCVGKKVSLNYDVKTLLKVKIG